MVSQPLNESIARGEPLESQQRIIEADQRQRQTRLGDSLRRLREAKSWVGLFEDAFDSYDTMLYGAPGRQYLADPSGHPGVVYDRPGAVANAMIHPCATATFYVNELQLRQIRAWSRAFVRDNPYWRGIQHNRVAYTVGTGHNYTVTAKKKNDPDVTPDLIDLCKGEIESFCRLNHYARRQEEKVIRQDRDGEYFLRYFEDHPDGVLRVRFVEPLCVSTPAGKSQATDTWFGVQFEGDLETPVAYYVQTLDYLGASPANAGQWQEIAADQMQHGKVNVDMASPRGVPTTYFVWARLEQAVRTLGAMGKLVHYRERIAILAKHINAVEGEIKTMLGNNPTQTDRNGQPQTIEDLPNAAILHHNNSTEYSFPRQEIETDKIVASVQADLRSAAAALGMAEYMVSADASNAAFASTMVAEGPVVKSFEIAQARIIEQDLEVLTRALRVAEDHGRLPAGTVDKIKINAEPPIIVSRNRLQETQADEILVRNRVMSQKTMAARNDLVWEDEQQEIQQQLDAGAGYSLDDPSVMDGGQRPNPNPNAASEEPK